MRVLAVGAALTVGCYHPSVATEVPCGPAGECPNGQTCDDQRQPPTCVGSNTPDAAVDAVDAGPPLNLCGDTSGLQAGAPWPLIHGCPTNSGRSAFLGPASGATLVAPTGTNHNRRGVVVSSSNQIIMQETSAGDIYEFDGATGGAGWTNLDPNGAGLEAFPVIDNQNLIYATTNYGKIYCVDAGSGSSPWNQQFSGAFSAPVMTAPGIIYFGAQAPYGVYAIDVVMRKQKWHYNVPNAGDARTAPAVGNGMVFFVDTVNSRLFALDAVTGDHKYDVPVLGTAVGSAVLGVDTIYVATSTNGIATFDAETGAAKWQQPVGVGAVQPALIANGDVVSSSVDGSAFVLDRASGNRAFSMTLGGKVLSPPVIDAADVIYFATDHGTVAYTATGALRWQSPLSGPIVLGDKMIVVLPGQNTLAVIGQ